MRALSYGKYNMLADVYEETVTLQPSGQRLREWDYENPVMTIECIARGLPASGLRTVGSTEEWSRYYEDIEWVRIKTTTQLDKSHRIGNIRTVNRWGDVTAHWINDEGVSEVFDVLGIMGTQDPWGQLIEYEVLARKPQD